MQRSLLDLHIALLKRLQTLSAQHQAKASGKTPRASQAPPTFPGSLASSLERWRDAFNWGGGAPTAGGWHPVTSAPQASSLQAEARSLARYYTQPDTVALLKANPNAVPQELRGPPGMSREQACKEANKMELPDLVGWCYSTASCCCAEAAPCIWGGCWLPARSQQRGLLQTAGSLRGGARLWCCVRPPAGLCCFEVTWSSQAAQQCTPAKCYAHQLVSTTASCSPPSFGPVQIKKQICDPKYPWVSADAAAGLDMDTFMEPQGGIISGQLGNWYKDVANRFGSLSRGRAPRYNTTVPFKPTATRPGPRRSLQASCGTTDSFLNVSPDRLPTGIWSSPGWMALQEWRAGQGRASCQ